MRRLRDLLTTRGRAFVSAGITLALCGIGLGFSDLTRIGILLIALPLFSALIMRRHDLRFALDRTPRPSRVQVDEPSTVTVTIENAGPSASPLLMAEEQLDYALGDRPRFVVSRLRRGDRQEIHYTVRSHVRGRHRLGPLGVRLRDPFGLSTRVAAISGAGDILVLPRIVPLGSGRPPGSGIGAEGAIPHMVALHGEDDVSIRAYRDGDDLRRIHWPSTAKTGDLMVRQEDRPARRRAVVVVDSRAAGHRGSGSSSSLEWAVTAAASVTAHLSEQGYAVHLVTDETADDGRAGAAIDLDHALEVLAEAQAGQPEQFAEVLHAAHPVTSSGGLVIAVVTALDEDLARQVAALRQPGGTGLAMVVDSASFGGQRRPTNAPTEPACVAVLRSAGWSAVVVGADDQLPSAWAALAGASNPVPA
ncbi:Uncharacterized conserved protein, DUF58 family, contains vWF domain [Pedococcus cremeus]|uniref:Uncharacterized conserved protein, DUF58 family, contains vWF domain n=1 Tax=Pedococcus cremeus TaxID=587636 RepID=A0A1H9XRP8_9MICO|nr:DUF58 domain-containing protein [Pedococcus cremeus]SES48811.1 Uncharacterized conserved protein, DUF58 family, contains vWF domain [Pedococcus cremeus]